MAPILRSTEVQESSEEFKDDHLSFIYVSHANRVISAHVRNGRADKISRARIEMQVLEGIDKEEFPFGFKLACIHVIMHTKTFELYWLGQANLHSLPKKATARLKPDLSLAKDVKAPSPLNSDESSPEPRGALTPPLSSGETPQAERPSKAADTNGTAVPGTMTDTEEDSSSDSSSPDSVLPKGDPEVTPGPPNRRPVRSMPRDVPPPDPSRALPMRPRPTYPPVLDGIPVFYPWPDEPALACSIFPPARDTATGEKRKASDDDNTTGPRKRKAVRFDLPADHVSPENRPKRAAKKRGALAPSS